MAERRASACLSYGLKKASILAALTNALFVLVAVGAIAVEAARGLLDPAPPAVVRVGRERARSP